MDGRATVLLVCEDRSQLFMAGDSLRMYGYDVVQVGSEAEAMEQLGSGLRLSVLVTDISVTLDGLKLARTARELRPRAHVIYTARMPHAVSQKGRVSGALLVRAPYRPAQIAALIAELQGKADPMPASRAA